MDTNIGRLDATLRTIGAVLALAFSLSLNANVAPSLILAVMAVLLTGTALTRKCPAYTLFGFTTCAKLPQPAEPLVATRVYK